MEKRKPLPIGLTPKEREKIDDAAERANLPASTFIRLAALKEAGK